MLSTVWAYNPFQSSGSGPKMYVLSCSSITPTAFPVTVMDRVYISAKTSWCDVALTSSTTSPSTARYNISAGERYNFPIEYNGTMYALSLGTNTATIQLMFVP